MLHALNQIHLFYFLKAIIYKLRQEFLLRFIKSFNQAFSGDSVTKSHVQSWFHTITDERKNSLRLRMFHTTSIRVTQMTIKRLVSL